MEIVEIDRREYAFEEIADSHYLTIKVHYKRIAIAKALLTLDEQEATLCDILVRNDILMPFCSNGLFLWLRRKVDFRNRGVGTKLLQFVCDTLRERGFNRITGKAVGKLDRLIPWYECNGFTVDPESHVISREL